MQQTKEHLLLAKQIGIRHLIIFINKCDLVDEMLKELVRDEIREILKKYDFDPASVPIIEGSALCAIEGKETFFFFQGSALQYVLFFFFSFILSVPYSTCR